MTFELGVYSFGNTLRTADGGHDTTAQALRNVLEAVHIADEVGLDFFGFGEHHTQSMPVSSPTALVNAADIAVAVHGFVAENDGEAKRTYLEHELRRVPYRFGRDQPPHAAAGPAAESFVTRAP
jgi:hypothetical protein